MGAIQSIDEFKCCIILQCITSAPGYYENTCVVFRISYSAGFKGVQTLGIFNLSTEYTQSQNQQLQKLTGLGINSEGCFQFLT